MTEFLQKKIVVDPAPNRNILDFRPLGFRDVSILGHYKYTSIHEALSWHDHGNMIEISLLESGTQNFILKEKEYTPLTNLDLHKVPSMYKSILNNLNLFWRLK